MSEDNIDKGSIRALELIRQAALEYNLSDYKFYTNGFFKFIRQGNSVFIEDIYVDPEFRNTPVSKMIMENFNNYLQKEGVTSWSGHVYKGSSSYQKRLDTFLRWGGIKGQTNDYYTVVVGAVR